MTYELWCGNEVVAHGYSEEALLAFIVATGHAGIVYNKSGYDVTAAFLQKESE